MAGDGGSRGLGGQAGINWRHGPMTQATGTVRLGGVALDGHELHWPLGDCVHNFFLFL